MLVYKNAPFLCVGHDEGLQPRSNLLVVGLSFPGGGGRSDGDPTFFVRRVLLAYMRDPICPGRRHKLDRVKMGRVEV